MATWNEARLRSELVAAGAELSRLGLIRAGEGNFSARIEGDRFLLTRAGAAKRRLVAHSLALCGCRSELPAGASSEGRMHQAVYRAFPEVAAIVHAHPPAVLALVARGGWPDVSRLTEAALLVGAVSRVEALPPGSAELAEAVARALRGATVAVMVGHGIVGVGATVEQAVARVLTVDLLAGILLHAGGPR
ncbi:MAG: class II aldolase/adducin family protein [Acidobacteriota bacterium]